MSKLTDWLRESNRWKHLLGGLTLGVLADGWYCAVYVGIGVAGAMEFKDWQWGGRPDLVDFLLTFAGCVIGYTIKYLLI